MTSHSKDVWRTERATRMSVIVDANDYFRHARAAMLKARRRIMLVGWDFDARIRLVEGEREPGEPEKIGEFIYWLVERAPELEVYLLRWDVGALKAVGRGSTALTVLKWVMHKRIHAKLDGKHPTGASHHQKIVAIDDCFAFCGGIDVTAARWDTRAHRDDDPRRLLPSGKPYKPWHDATSAVQGPVAAALGDLARERWRRAGGGELAAIPGIDDCWPDELVADFEDVDVGIARTVPEMADQGRGARDRGAVRQPDRLGQAADLCREPVFRLAPHRRGDRRAARRGEWAGDRHHQSGDLGRLAAAAGDGHRPRPAGDRAAPARPP
jgi:phosphatidylserine/phosphatidylglycerophosphate/cardiolipin synthase-like enzyme